jgi:drug/metabolite transporter (DMT)-like permease
MVFFVGIAAAICLGLGYVLQQRVAARSKESSGHAVRLLLDLMHQRAWWAGVIVMIIGQLLGGLALGLASVAVVEPLLSASLLFAFIIAAFLSNQRVRWHEILGALLVSAALGVFLAVGDPLSSDHPKANRAVVVLAIAVVAGVVATLVIVGTRRGLVVRSVLFATGAGLLYGLQDVSTRAAAFNIDHLGVRQVFLHAWVYVVIGAAIVGIALSQSAFRAARLDHSLPPIAAAEPIAGIALGIFLLGDTVSVSIPGLAAEAACIAAMIVGVIFIGRSKSLADCGTDVLEASVSESSVSEVPVSEVPVSEVTASTVPIAEPVPSTTPSRRPRLDTDRFREGGLTRPAPRKRLADLEP